MSITHFMLEEFLNSDTADSMGLNNYPTWEEVENLKRLGETMEKVRTFLGNKPVTVLSGFRCQEVNAAVGGAASSAHLYGLGCDFVVEGYSPIEACRALEPHVKELQIDQLIHEFDDWVHLGLTTGTPRYQCLTIDNNGTFNGFK